LASFVGVIGGDAQKEDSGVTSQQKSKSTTNSAFDATMFAFQRIYQKN